LGLAVSFDFSFEAGMIRCFATLTLLVALCSCRAYDFMPRLDDQHGLIPPDQFARYGREQAEAVAIGREYGKALRGDSPADLTRQAESAVRYARSLPDVTNVTADPLGLRLTIQFKSGWREAVNPIADGKSGPETPGLSTSATPPPPR
jgi:hypothetical protein